MTMKMIRTAVLSVVSALMLIASVNAEENAMKGLKLGFGFDRGFGVVGAIGDFYGFIGNDGAAIDYIFTRDTLKIEAEGPMFWYVGAGGYGDWDGDIGARLPVGAEWYFAKNLDAFAQIIPRLRLNNDAKFGVDFSIGVRYQF